MADVVAFWAAALIVAVLGFPIAAVLLRRLPDAGAGLSFPLGLVIASYIYFILRVLRVLPPGRGGYLAAIALLGLIAAATAGRDRWLAVTWWRAWPGLVAAFGLFTLAFFGYVAFRSYNAEVGGTEQPMDLMYLNATLNSEEYPPKDPWLAGEPASYYYFGYLQSGVLTSAAGVTPSSGYNLSLAYTFAAGATGVASLAYALARWMLGAKARRLALAAGVLAVVLLLFVGSLAAVFEWTAAHGHVDRGLYRTFGVEEIASCSVPKVTDYCYSGTVQPRTSEWYPTEFWFWFRDTRIIPDTITEFPFFSFLLGDLHPHVMSIPMVLLTLGLAAATWRSRGLLDLRSHLKSPAASVALAVVFGALAFQNAWDVLTFSLAFALGVFARNSRRERPGTALLGTVLYLVPVGVAAAALYLPWALDFSSQAKGFEPYIGRGTRPGQVLLQFGPLVVASALLGLTAFRDRDRGRAVNIALATAWIPVLPFLGWVALAGIKGDLSAGVDARTSAGWLTLIIYGGLVWLLAYASVAFAVSRRALAFPAALGATGVLLLYGSELFVIKDIFFGAAPRLNTIFKLSYQAWILLSVAGAVGLAGIAKEVGRRPGAAAVGSISAVLVMLGLAYPLLAAFNRTDRFRQETAIDGLAAVQRSDPGEYDLVQWIRASTPADAVILEATGRSWGPGSSGPVLLNANVDYSDSGRISERTGRSTPIGWYFHEIQWRGDTEHNRAAFVHRQDEVDAAYLSRDPERVLAVMREYGAEYLVVGRVELSRYAALLDDFSQFLDVAHRSGQYVIYRVPHYQTVQTS
jgi:YYY domain-containing protein